MWQLNRIMPNGVRVKSNPPYIFNKYEDAFNAMLRMDFVFGYTHIVERV